MMRSLLAAACAASLLMLSACGAGGPAASEPGVDLETSPAAQTAPAADAAADADLETIRFAVSGMG